MHKISLRENVCTVRVCDALLSLLSLLIDFGILANRGRKESKKASEAKEAVEKAKAETDAKMGRKGSGKATSPSGKKSIVPEEKEDKKDEKEDEGDQDGILSLHNTFMDVVVR